MSDKRHAYVVDASVFRGAGVEPLKDYRKNSDFIVPIQVIDALEEQDPRKLGASYGSRLAFEFLERVRRQCNNETICYEGAKLGNGNRLIVPKEREGVAYRKLAYAVIDTTRGYAKYHGSNPTTILSNSPGTRFRANQNKISAEPYGDEFNPFSGWFRDIKVDEQELAAAQARKESGRNFNAKAWEEAVIAAVHARADELHISTPSHVALTIKDDANHKGVWLANVNNKSVKPLESQSLGNVKPMNYEQKIAISYLLDPEIRLVSLGGIAGAGKTFLSLAAGLNQISQHSDYNKIIVYRTLYGVGQQNLGFLPGTEAEKMAPWAEAIYDDVEIIDKRRIQTKYNQFGREYQVIDGIEVKPITYIRGVTKRNSIIIVDDAQSLERSELLDVLSRVKDTKVVFTHDMSQNDNNYVSRGTSVVKLVNDLMNKEMVASINFTESQRDSLAQIASEMRLAEIGL